MITIFEKNNDLKQLKEILDYIRINDIDYDIIKVALDYLITSNKRTLIKYKIEDKKSETAAYFPRLNIIKVSPIGLKKWVQVNLSLKEAIKSSISDEELRSYLYLFVLAHEVSHAHQNFISESKIEVPYNVITEIYKDITNIFNKNISIIPGSEIISLIRLVLYKFREDSYILERNAIIEAVILLKNLSIYEGNNSALYFFDELLNILFKTGYSNKYNGCVEETYKRLLMSHKYKKLNTDEIIDESERLRYGLSINRKI